MANLTKFLTKDLSHVVETDLTDAISKISKKKQTTITNEELMINIELEKLELRKRELDIKDRELELRERELVLKENFVQTRR